MRLLAVIGAAVAVAAFAASGLSAPLQSAPVAASQVYATWSIPARQIAFHTVSCGRGYDATGGAVLGGPPSGQLLHSGPFGLRSWQFRVANYGNEDADLTVVVTCVRVPQLGTIAATTSSQTFTFARPISYTFRVGCGQGLAPTGVGYSIQPQRQPQALAPTPRTHVHIATMRPERGRWVVRAESHGDPVRMTVHARCLRRVTRGRSLVVARSDRRVRASDGESIFRRRCPRRFHRLHAGHTAGLGIHTTAVPQRDGSALFRVANNGPPRPVTLHLLCLAPRTSS